MVTTSARVKAAKEFAAKWKGQGYEKGQSQAFWLELLQKVDVGLLVAFPNYEDRKRHLEWYKSKISTQLA